MSDLNPSSSVGTRTRRFSEIDDSNGEEYQFRSRVPFKTFEDRLQESRLLFYGTVTPIGGYSRRHPNEDATTVYRSLCLRGFVVQGSLNPSSRRLDDVFRVIDEIGWSYSVLHVNPFCPRVVREFISNIPFYDDGVLIRGYVYRFSPSLINELMMTPPVEQPYKWKEVVLDHAIAHLTGGQCAGWTGFSLNALFDPFKILYRVCERSWLPGPDSDLMMKKRLRLMYAVTKRKQIDFGQLVYEQVIDMARVRDLDTNLVFPNLIYQLLMLQREIPLLPGDEDLIGKGIPICELRSDGSGPRGRRRLC